MTSDVRDRSRQFAMVPLDVIDSIKDAKSLALYCILKKYANQSTRQAHPSRSTLAAHMGYKTARPVDEAVEYLKVLGLVRTYSRYRDDAGNIGYQKDERFRERTSNGYEIYDFPSGQNAPLWPTGHNPYSPQDITPMACGTQELDPREPDPREPEREGASAPVADATPPTPQPKQSSTRAHELPDGWRPDDHVWEQMRQKRPDVDIEEEHSKFVDYWPAQPGSKSRKKDWNATWRNWIRNARPTPRQKSASQNDWEGWTGSPAPTSQENHGALFGSDVIDHQESF